MHAYIMTCMGFPCRTILGQKSKVEWDATRCYIHDPFKRLMQPKRLRAGMYLSLSTSLGKLAASLEGASSFAIAFHVVDKLLDIFHSWRCGATIFHALLSHSHLAGPVVWKCVLLRSVMYP